MRVTEPEKQKWPFDPLQPGDQEPVQAPPRRKLLAAACAGVILAGLGACASPESENQRSAGEFTDDAAVTAKVKTAIATDAGARTAAAVNVETYRGVVQLTGFVDSEDQASRAVSAAKKVQGVRSVRNDIRLKR
jgi:hyperosmotically inducible periplasmic protein